MTSQVVQWLRLHAPYEGDLGLILDQRTRSHMLQVKIPYVAAGDPACHNEDLVQPNK